MLIKLSIYEGLTQISRPELILDETVIPSRCTPNPNSPYKANYEWLFEYERKLCRFLKPWMSHLRYELIGDKGVLCEALSNAFSHAHGKDPDKLITVRVYKGEQGLLIRIKDCGNGFDVQFVIKQYAKGKTYYHTAGNGLHNMVISPFDIFYTDNGAAFNLLYLFDKTACNC